MSRRPYERAVARLAELNRLAYRTLADVAEEQALLGSLTREWAACRAAFSRAQCSVAMARRGLGWPSRGEVKRGICGSKRLESARASLSAGMVADYGRWYIERAIADAEGTT